jgi:hypothetical protein
MVTRQGTPHTDTTVVVRANSWVDIVKGVSGFGENSGKVPITPGDRNPVRFSNPIAT